MSKGQKPAIPVRSSQPPWVAERLPPGVTYRQLDWWARRGFVKLPGRGSGRNRVLDDTELEIAELIGRLTAAGVTLPRAAAVARQLIEHPEDVSVPIGRGLAITLTERLDDGSEPDDGGFYTDADRGYDQYAFALDYGLRLGAG